MSTCYPVPSLVALLGTKMATTVIALEEPLMQEAVARLVETVGSQVVACCSTVSDALDAALKRKPKLFVTDVGLGPTLTFDLVRQVRNSVPGVRILVISRNPIISSRNDS